MSSTHSNHQECYHKNLIIKHPRGGPSYSIPLNLAYIRTEKDWYFTRATPPFAG